MMAKVISVQMVSMLGYDFLFQDVDIVWFKNPLSYFLNHSDVANKYHVIFQEDGGHPVRYNPYSANSGFYFVRYSQLTRHLMTTILMAGDVLLRAASHQQAVILFLNEFVSLYGLKVKIVNARHEEFPGGFQFHQRSKDYMKKMFNGTFKPYIFHMSWTENKDNKLLFFRQLSEWYVQDDCIGKKVNEIHTYDQNENSTTLIKLCCSTTGMFSCHYRDKPSIRPCRQSPPIDKGKRSWW